jgi:predicted nucleic acid-binding protein
VTAYLVDTNCLISYYTDRSPSQHEAISAYVLRATELALSLHIVPHVLSELVYVLERVHDVSSPRVADLVRKTLDTPGIEYLEAHPVGQILDVWPRPISDYGDAVVAAVALGSRMPVLTFDRTFARRLGRLGVEAEIPS